MTQKKSLAGKVLAAQPTLLDSNFHQSLVFLAEHNAEGAMGFVLNRPIGTTLGQATSGTKPPGWMAQLPLLYGGPVQRENLLLAVFIAEKPGSYTCRFGMPVEQIEAHFEAGHKIRAFSGYSGWSAGQLESELKSKTWKVCEPDPALFVDHVVSGLWPFFIGEDTRWRQFTDKLPVDPELN